MVKDLEAEWKQCGYSETTVVVVMRVAREGVVLVMVGAGARLSAGAK